MIERQDDGPPAWVKFGKMLTTVIIPIVFIWYSFHFIDRWNTNQQHEKMVQPSNKNADTTSVEQERPEKQSPNY